jgi:hypothetical protein
LHQIYKAPVRLKPVNRGGGAAGANAVKGPVPRAPELDAALGPRVGGVAPQAPPRCPCARRAHPADAGMRLGAEPRGPASDPKR